MAATEVRGFVEADRAGLLELFARVGEGSPTESLWGHPESEAAIYLTPYLDREPESLFVALLDNHLVGYLTGCVDSTAFPTEDERMETAVRAHKLFRRRETRAFFIRAMRDITGAKLRRQPTAGELSDPRWPAHLHVNVAPEGRGTGLADELMRRWIDRLTESGSPGCYLQTLTENTRAVRFFRRWGFDDHGDAPLVPGIRYDGQRLHQLTMVRTLATGAGA